MGVRTEEGGKILKFKNTCISTERHFILTKQNDLRHTVTSFVT